MIRRLREICISIRRVVYWLPILWKDRWWDSCFLLRIMEIKLRYDANGYKNNGMACGAERISKQMLIAAALCRRLNEQEYTTPWDKERTESANRLWNYMKGHVEIIGNGLVAHTSKGYKEQKSLRDASRWANERESEMKKQDLDYLCLILRKYLLGWWD